MGIKRGVKVSLPLNKLAGSAYQFEIEELIQNHLAKDDSDRAGKIKEILSSDQAWRELEQFIAKTYTEQLDDLFIDWFYPLDYSPDDDVVPLDDPDVVDHSVYAHFNGDFMPSVKGLAELQSAYTLKLIDPARLFGLIYEQHLGGDAGKLIDLPLTDAAWRAEDIEVYLMTCLAMFGFEQGFFDPNIDRWGDAIDAYNTANHFDSLFGGGCNAALIAFVNGNLEGAWSSYLRLILGDY